MGPTTIYTDTYVNAHTGTYTNTCANAYGWAYANTYANANTRTHAYAYSHSRVEIAPEAETGDDVAAGMGVGVSGLCVAN